MTIQETILCKLDQFEKTHRVRIPIAIESGSRAWGFSSPDSDYDCRFLYVRPPEQYLSVFPQKDTIEETPDAVLDVGGWDVRKVIQHLVKSNAVMYEWLSSQVVYRMDEPIRQELTALGNAFFNPIAVGWHYLSMARNKIADLTSQNQSKLKTYCYVMRPLCCIRYMAQCGTVPHMEYRRNLAAIPLDNHLRMEIQHLLEEKENTGEGHLVPQNKILLDYFHKESTWAEAWLSSLHYNKKQDYESANQTFRNIIRRVYPHD